MDYNEVVQLNFSVVVLAIDYQKTENIQTGYEIYELLLPITTQIIESFIRKVSAPIALKEDMLTEAYLRLHWAILCYNYSHSPVFITYWRITLSNFLSTQYSKHWKHYSIPEHFDEMRTYSDAALEIQEIKEFCNNLISEWKIETQIKLAKMIFDHRIFCLPEDMILQREIAKTLGIQSGVVSQWENWLRAKIKERFSDE